MPTPLTLRVELGPCSGITFEAASRLKHVTIGRTRANRFQIKDETISQKHMSIDWIDDAWMAQDQGSSNGTTINGEDIGVKVPVRIKNGDLVRIGVDTRIRVVLPDDGESDDRSNAAHDDGKADVDGKAAAAEVQVGKAAAAEVRDDHGKAASEVDQIPIEDDNGNPHPQDDHNGEVVMREWFKQQAVRIPVKLREKAEAEIRELQQHAEQIKARLLAGEF